MRAAFSNPGSGAPGCTRTGHDAQAPWRTLPEQLRRILLYGADLRARQVTHVGVLPWLERRYEHAVEQRGPHPRSRLVIEIGPDGGDRGGERSRTLQGRATHDAASQREAYHRYGDSGDHSVQDRHICEVPEEQRALGFDEIGRRVEAADGV